MALDALLTLGQVGALYCNAQVAGNIRSARNRTLLVGLLGGSGMLAKGPPALVNKSAAARVGVATPARRRRARLALRGSVLAGSRRVFVVALAR